MFIHKTCLNEVETKYEQLNGMGVHDSDVSPYSYSWCPHCRCQLMYHEIDFSEDEDVF